MGSQTMASKAGGGGVARRGGGRMRSLGRQGSMYSLTLDEVQSQLGEPLHSMNLDELLRSVFPDGLAIADGAGATTSSQQHQPGSGLLRQGSITMPPELSKKTVDEVWKGIQAAPKRNAETGGGGGGGRRRRERQPTLGEVTLEDFLVKAGVVTQGSLKELSDVGNVDPVGRGVTATGTVDLAPGSHWIEQYKQQIASTDAHHHGQQGVQGAYFPNRLVPQPLNVGPGAILEPSYSDGQTSSGMIGGMSDSQTPGRKRGMSGDVADKLMERRQKRMIKNRESAARSRARKQAYTNELENKVSRLEEENVRLKRQKVLSFPLQLYQNVANFPYQVFFPGACLSYKLTN
ncbi:Os01g0813100 [Oryza sativa Japonica Group]|uniref:Os01g0813100 protein n=1 Tax=Oryza sativa subsp. japonica TaxID=39947 RepID=A0A0P0V9J7_ORYSJ|nr:Os01g0813100 [Oryza sativa Japonica Group]